MNFPAPSPAYSLWYSWCIIHLIDMGFSYIKKCHELAMLTFNVGWMDRGGQCRKSSHIKHCHHFSILSFGTKSSWFRWGDRWVFMLSIWNDRKIWNAPELYFISNLPKLTTNGNFFYENRVIFLWYRSSSSWCKECPM